MKTRMILCALVAALSPVAAFAHSDKLDLMGDVIASALNQFETDAPNSKANFVGVKGWIDADQIMVKVYLTGNAEILYSCSVMEMGGGQPDMISCAKQGN